MDLTLVNLEHPTEVRTFPKGRFRGLSGRPDDARPGHLRSRLEVVEHVGAGTGASWCQVEHVGLVISGAGVARMDDGTERIMRAGDFFYVPPGHDSWVVGDEPYVSLHIMGSEGYAT